MTYVPPAPPRYRLYHRNWRSAFHTNSKAGSLAARAVHAARVDNDWCMSADLKWLNAHGYPEEIWLANEHNFRKHEWADLRQRRYTHAGHVYQLRNPIQAFRDNHLCGLGTEFEVKNIAPIYDAELADAFKRLAVSARHVYGDGFRDHVTVKCLTSLAGGEAYALRVLAAAHAAGFKTMLLARGKCRFKSYAGHTYLSYVRGRVIRR
jgi:hypothetical protein